MEAVPVEVIGIIATFFDWREKCLYRTIATKFHEAIESSTKELIVSDPRFHRMYAPEFRESSAELLGGFTMIRSLKLRVPSPPEEDAPLEWLGLLSESEAQISAFSASQPVSAAAGQLLLAFPDLSELDVKLDPKAELGAIIKGLPRLRDLKLGGELKEVEALVEGRSLASLAITQASQGIGDVLKELAPQLRSLSIQQQPTENLSAQELQELAPLCAGLDSLTLVGTSLDPAALGAFAKHCVQLRSLNINGSRSLCLGLSSEEGATGPDAPQDGSAQLESRCRLLAAINARSAQNNVPEERRKRVGSVLASGKWRLEELDVGQVDLSSDDLVDIAAADFPLKQLIISRNRQLRDRGLLSLSHLAPGLREFRVSGCWQLTDASLGSILPRCQSLTCLSLSLCPSLTPACLIEVFKACRNLRMVFWDRGEMLGTTEAIGSAVPVEGEDGPSEILQALWANCPSLRSFSTCERILDLAAFEGIPPCLTSLKLGHCGLDDHCLEHIVTHCQRLEVLHLHGSKFGFEAIRRFADLPNLRSLKFNYEDTHFGGLMHILKHSPILSEVDIGFHHSFTYPQLEAVSRLKSPVVITPDQEFAVYNPYFRRSNKAFYES